MSNILSLLFIACAAISFLNVKKLYADKAVKGVCYKPCIVFTLTNLFEVFYFGRVHDWLPVIGAIAMLVSNLTWLGLVFAYRVGEQDAPLFS